MTRRLDPHSWMWDEALASVERAERRHRHFFALFCDRQRQPTWQPPVDIFETNDGFRIFVVLPGVRLEQVKLFLESTGLVVRTEREPPSSIESLRIRRLEIPYGIFERHIALPPGRYTLREQQMADGCLELHLAKE